RTVCRERNVLQLQTCSGECELHAMTRAGCRAFLATMAMACTASVVAEPVVSNPDPMATRIDAADLRAWLDGRVPYALDRGRIAGGVIVVVQDGQVILQQGYGKADVAKGIAVDAERTLFR